ncbi:MAG: hypothetical protein V2A63_02305 [Patescibacteria group bacterium]
MSQERVLGPEERLQGAEKPDRILAFTVPARPGDLHQYLAQANSIKLQAGLWLQDIFKLRPKDLYKTWGIWFDQPTEEMARRGQPIVLKCRVPSGYSDVDLSKFKTAIGGMFFDRLPTSEHVDIAVKDAVPPRAGPRSKIARTLGLVGPRVDRDRWPAGALEADARLPTEQSLLKQLQFLDLDNQ